MTTQDATQMAKILLEGMATPIKGVPSIQVINPDNALRLATGTLMGLFKLAQEEADRLRAGLQQIHDLPMAHDRDSAFKLLNQIGDLARGLLEK